MRFDNRKCLTLGRPTIYTGYTTTNHGACSVSPWHPPLQMEWVGCCPIPAPSKLPGSFFQGRVFGDRQSSITTMEDRVWTTDLLSLPALPHSLTSESSASGIDSLSERILVSLPPQGGYNSMPGGCAGHMLGLLPLCGIGETTPHAS